MLTYTARLSVEQTVTDDDIQQHVEDALDWADLSVDGSRIRVTVDKGVVTLRGTVDTPPEKLTAERVALRVRGVETVLNHLAVSSRAVIDHHLHQSESRREDIDYVDALFTLLRQASGAIGRGTRDRVDDEGGS